MLEDAEESAAAARDLAAQLALSLSFITPNKLIDHSLTAVSPRINDPTGAGTYA
jgi:hypothetical protein